VKTLNISDADKVSILSGRALELLKVNA